MPASADRFNKKDPFPTFFLQQFPLLFYHIPVLVAFECAPGTGKHCPFRTAIDHTSFGASSGTARYTVNANRMATRDMAKAMK